MTKRIVDTGPALTKLVDTGPALPVVDPTNLAEGLGAHEASVHSRENASPIAWWAVRQHLFEALTSSGGRPARKGATRRQKIPLAEAEWDKLCQIAEALRHSGVRATPGQVAGALLHQVLEQMATTTATARPRAGSVVAS